MTASTIPAARVWLRLAVVAICAAAPTRSAEARSEAELFRLANGMRWIAAPMESPGEATVLLTPELEEAKARLAGESRKPDDRVHGQHLADWLAMTGDLRPAFEHTARLRTVTAGQVRALARDTFRPANRTVVTSVTARSDRSEAAPAVEGKIARDGFDLWYRIYGSGRPVLMLSGGPGLDCDYLEPVARELARREQAILVELRGTGRSRPPVVSAETISVETYLADLEALRAHLKIESWTVLGHSAGGSLGLFYAAAHPASVAALVLVSAGHVVHEPDNAVTDNVFMRLSAGEQQQVRELATSSGGTPAERTAARMRLMLPGYFFDRGKAAEMAAAMKESSVHFDTMQLLMRALLYPGMDLRPALKDFARPVLVIAGRQDPLDPKVQYETHLALRASTLELVPRCGHFPWIEQPERFYAAVDRLLARAVDGSEP
jgi:proline iminopeptidase